MQVVCSSGWGVSLCLVLATLVGCGKAHERFAISGQVTLDGKPVSQALIAFEPIEATPGTGGICVIKEGKFELEAGICAGRYAVRISDERPDLEEFEEKRFSGKAPIPVPVIPVAYAKSGAFEVTVNGPRSDLLFEMQRSKDTAK